MANPFNPDKTFYLPQVQSLEDTDHIRMLPSQTPFPRSWRGTDLCFWEIGLSDLRPVGTRMYGRYDYDQLPPIPLKLRGDFDWLSNQPIHVRNIGSEQQEDNALALANLRNRSAQLGLVLPDSFLTFMDNNSLPKRIRSATDCFLDLSSEPIISPIGDGYLIRILSDSQACLFWYLYLRPEGSDHAVVATEDFYGTELERCEDQSPCHASDIAFCAESFEAFVCRFWIENEIQFSLSGHTDMPSLGREYIDRYKNTR